MTIPFACFPFEQRRQSFRLAKTPRNSERSTEFPKAPSVQAILKATQPTDELPDAQRTQGKALPRTPSPAETQRRGEEPEATHGTGKGNVQTISRTERKPYLPLEVPLYFEDYETWKSEIG